MLGAQNYDFNNETDYCINIFLKFVLAHFQKFIIIANQI